MLKDFRTQKIKWDKADNVINAGLSAHEGDQNGRKLALQITDAGEQEDLTGASVSLAWQTRKGDHYGLEAFTETDGEFGLFELVYPTGMLTNVGVLKASIVLIVDGSRLESKAFAITVSQSNVNDGAIESENSFTALTNALVKVDSWNDDLEGFKLGWEDTFSQLEANYAPRLNEVTAQLAQNKKEKIGGGVLAGMGDLSQDVKTAMTGGSVAVVDQGAVNAVTLANDVKHLTGIKEVNLHKSPLLNGYILDSNGAFISQANRRATEFIPIDEHKIIYTNRRSFTVPNVSTQTVVFYDENKTFIGKVVSDKDYVEPLLNSKFMRMTVVVNSDVEVFDSGNFVVWQEYESNTIESLNQVRDDVLNIDYTNLFKGNVLYGTTRQEDGAVVFNGDTNRVTTEFIELSSDKLISTNWFDLLEPANAVLNMPFVFYDIEGKFISAAVTTNGSLKPPSNAKYVRFNLKAPGWSVEPGLFKVWQEGVVESKTIEKISSDLTETMQDVDVFLKEKNFPTDRHDKVYVSDFYSPDLTDSEIINNCLDFTSILKNRVLVFDNKDWYIDEAILLPSNTIVVVDGVTIKQNNDVFDNVFRGNNMVIDPENPHHYPLSISPIEHIYIYGINGAKIEGPDINARMIHPTLGEQEAVGDYWGWRTLQIALSKCTHFEISGFSFIKTRCWAMSFDKCSHFKVYDIEVDSNVKNGDGVDIRFGCHDFEVYGITGSTSDDTVAINSIDYFPSAGYVYPMEPSAFENDQIPIEELSIHDGYVSGVHTAGRHHGVIVLANAGRKVHDILINDIKEPFKSGRESVVKIYSGYGDGYNDNDIHKIRVNNVVSKGATYAVQVTHKVNDVWFNNISQENINGELSSISHAEGITITNVN